MEMSNSAFQDKAVDFIIYSLNDDYGENKDSYIAYREECPEKKEDGSNGRVDLKAGLLTDDGRPILLMNFEMKSSINDMKTGNGLNFNEQYNFIVVPFDLKIIRRAESLLKALDRNDVGIIAIDDIGTICLRGSSVNSNCEWLKKVYKDKRKKMPTFKNDNLYVGYTIEGTMI